MCGRRQLRLLRSRNVNVLKPLRFLKQRRFAIISSKLEVAGADLRQGWDQLHQMYCWGKSAMEVAVLIAGARGSAFAARVGAWLENVDSLEEAIKETYTLIQSLNDQGAKFYGMDWRSRYSLVNQIIKAGKKVKQLNHQVQKYRAEAKGAFEQPLVPKNEIPVSEAVGMDSKLETLMGFIGEEKTGIIGLYGMGGSGKTTLMKKLHNNLAEGSKIRRDFALVIWIDVSGGCDIDKIIDDLRESCKIDGENWEEKSRADKARKIFNDLKGKKYILFMDGAWEEINLESIGVPPPSEANGSKIVITTRLEKVCDTMKAKKFKVECLEENQALDLLCMSAGDETIKRDQALSKVARELSQECQGLPSALVAVGKFMAGRKKPESWKHWLKMLKNFPSTSIKGMEQDVFVPLKSSYDRLPGTTEQNCFLYFALFPKGQIISVHDLIRLWIGNGLLEDPYESIQDAFNHGEDVIESLNGASLLEDCGDNSVKMHNVIQNMALWLARDRDQMRDKVIVQDEASGSSQHGHVKNWEIVEKISVSDYHISHANKEVLTWNVPMAGTNVETLMVRGNNVLVIRDLENVQYMRRLKVLSLRYVEGITTLPRGIGLLTELQYLELSNLKIEERLPIEMKKLKSLRVFLLEHVHFSLETIPEEVISHLESLMVFSFWRKWSSSKPMGDHSPSTSFTSVPYWLEETFLKCLEELPLLENISLTLETPSGINKLLSSTQLQRRIRNVGLIGQPTGEITTAIAPSMIESLAKMQYLEAIHLVAWQDGLEEISRFRVKQIDIFEQLSEVQILDCDSVTHLTLLSFAPLLRSLIVVNCGFLKEVIMEIVDVCGSAFGNLQSMVLKFLPKLVSVCKKPLPFPKLTVMEIVGCPSLKKLPLDGNSAARTLKRISGEKTWWDNLDWEDDSMGKAREFLQSKFTSDDSNGS